MLNERYIFIYTTSSSQKYPSSTQTNLTYKTTSILHTSHITNKSTKLFPFSNKRFQEFTLSRHLVTAHSHTQRILEDPPLPTVTFAVIPDNILHPRPDGAHHGFLHIGLNSLVLNTAKLSKGVTKNQQFASVRYGKQNKSKQISPSFILHYWFGTDTKWMQKKPSTALTWISICYPEIISYFCTVIV